MTSSKIKIKTCVCLFFQMLICFRVGAVIFELDEASISSFVEFRLQSMTLKIEHMFEEKKKKKIALKMAQKCHE